jgi:sugar phosphate permease
LDRVSHLAVLSLLFARVIYAINWFNIASIFPHIALDFKQDVSLLGLLSTSFFLGIGLFQMPGGILAAIQGPRRTAIYWITIASSAALLCGLSSQLQQMEVLRFVIGLGMALFFGPSVTLVTRYLGRGSEGLAVGLLNSAHSGRTTQNAVKYALSIGYRHVDTASLYGNEVGIAVRESGLDRDEVFITTKVWNSEQGYDSTLRACEGSLRRLGSTYVDLVDVEQ